MNKATVDSVMALYDKAEDAARHDGHAFAGPMEKSRLRNVRDLLHIEVERLADQAEPAQRPDREVRLLTSKDIDDVRKTLWRDAQMNLSDLHAEDAAKAFQCKFCEVNGLTVKDQS